MTRKAVFCIRHGESTFNVAFRETGIDPLHVDARLTEEGLRQVEAAREKLHPIPFELVVTSPFTRALQTTAGIFADHPSEPRIVVEALHREHGGSSCDIGRAPSLLSAEFPAYALDHLPEIWWHEDGRPDENGICYEPHDVLLERVDTFRSWLRERPERRIAVIGHGTFFFHLTGQRLANCEILEFDVETDPVAGLG
jgi:broad specificity phosphatase PhoE